MVGIERKAALLGDGPLGVITLLGDGSLALSMTATSGSPASAAECADSQITSISSIS